MEGGRRGGGGRAASTTSRGGASGAAPRAGARGRTSRFSTMRVGDLDAGAGRLWPLISEQVTSTRGAQQDERRLRSVLSRRRAKSQEFFASAAGGWDRIRGELFGDEFFLWAVLG